MLLEGSIGFYLANLGCIIGTLGAFGGSDFSRIGSSFPVLLFTNCIGLANWADLSVRVMADGKYLDFEKLLEVNMPVL